MDITSNNQRLGLETLVPFNAVLWVSFFKMRVIRLQVIGSPKMRDQVAFFAFFSFSVEDQTNADYICAVHA